MERGAQAAHDRDARRGARSIESEADLAALVKRCEAIGAAFIALPLPLPGTAYTKGVRAKDQSIAYYAELARAHRAGSYDDGLARLLAARNPDGTAIGDAEAAGELNHLFLAGYIVFGQFAATIVHLTQHPEVRERLAAETAALPGAPTTADLSANAYLMHVVDEVRRMTPIVPVVIGKAARSFVVDGFEIPAGGAWPRRCGITTAKKRRTASPRSSIRERFGERAEHRSHAYAYAPQGAGPPESHRCPGFDLTTFFMALFAARLVRGSSWVLAEQDLTPNGASSRRCRATDCAPSSQRADRALDVFHRRRGSGAARDRDRGAVEIPGRRRRRAVGESGAGAIATQAWANTTFGPRALELLRRGEPPEQIAQTLLAADENAGDRQFGIVGADGRAATFTGRACIAWAGGITGEHFAAQGNCLAGSGVVDAMASTFREHRGPLAYRLVAALAAGQREGGDKRGQQSAALLVLKPGGGYAGFNDRYVDLRVDDHTQPIDELARLLELHALYHFPAAPDDVLPVDDALGRELVSELVRVRALKRHDEGAFDDEARAALVAFMHVENLGNRVRAKQHDRPPNAGLPARVHKQKKPPHG